MNILGQNQRGASILEFVIVVIPLLLILMVTAIEFSAIFTRLNTLTKTVQDGARYLSDVSVSKSNTDAQKAVVVNLIKYGRPVNDNGYLQQLPGTYSAPAGCPGFVCNPDADHVQVSVTYNHTPIMGQTLSNLLQMFDGSAINLTIPFNASSVTRYVQ